MYMPFINIDAILKALVERYQVDGELGDYHISKSCSCSAVCCSHEQQRKCKFYNTLHSEAGPDTHVHGRWGLPGVPDDTEDHDLLQPLIHVPRCDREDVNCVWVILRA